LYGTLYARHGTRAGFRVLEGNILFTERSAGRGDDSRPGVCAPAKSTRVTRHIRRRVAPPSARVSTGVGSARPSIAIQLYSAIQRYTLYSAIQRYTLYSYTALYTIYTTSTTPLWTAHSRALIDAHLLKALVLKLDYTVTKSARFLLAPSSMRPSPLPLKAMERVVHAAIEVRGLERYLWGWGKMGRNPVQG